MSELEPAKLTWAVLLGRWIELAHSAVALPDDSAGRAWKQAVTEIIGLQAVTMALGEADQLMADERALGLDRARILLERHTQRLHALFDPQPLHPMLTELLDDAQAAVQRAEQMIKSQ